MLTNGRSNLAERALLRLAGGSFVGGFLVYAIATQFHPSGDDHPVIFDKYADSARVADEGACLHHCLQLTRVEPSRDERSRARSKR